MAVDRDGRHLRESQCEWVADGGCRCVLSSTESRDPPMAEILTLDLTHYPPLCLPDQEMAGILSWTLNDPSIPAAGSSGRAPRTMAPR